MYITDNPVRDWDSYCEQKDRMLSRLPRCCECGEPIQEEACYELEQGKYTCPVCLDELYHRWTDDLTD